MIAHVDENGKTHPLSEHLFKSAETARNFANVFGFGDWAYLATLWHDLGKYSRKFQEKLTLDTNIQVDHSTAGAQYAVRYFPYPCPTGKILAYLIAGHHAGLPNFKDGDHPHASLHGRLNKAIEPYESNVPEEILHPKVTLSPPDGIHDPALWVRMLFSSLVDADFLNTEAFFDSFASSQRGGYRNIEELAAIFDTFMREMRRDTLPTPLNDIRNEILLQSLQAAENAPGIYTMTVPTGGGKTLSSMAFALRHALKCGKKRVIYVIPYTSIIEQNADVYRRIFGEDVVEHHSQFAPDEEKDENFFRAKLAAENWDAPVIVTTTVQFFESLFAAKPSRCRKLHNIAESVVVIDEVQTLPPEYLQPIYDKINALSSDYGVTFLLSSATVPDLSSFQTIEKGFRGLDDAKEIINDPEALNLQLRRTKIMWDHETPKSYEGLAQEIVQCDSSALVVVNTRDRAKKLYETLKNSGKDVLHLSANMCGAHRSETIERIRQKLQMGQKIIVISTNLIEAGVDLDFPLLWREFAGLDSIVQASGRCNREGLLPDKGIVRIFTLEGEKRPRYLEGPISALQSVLPTIDDPLSPEASRKYFGTYYRQLNERLDQKKIVDDESRTLEWPFRTIAEKFRLIDDGYTQNVLIPYDHRAESLLSLLVDAEPLNQTLGRQLQRYSITLPHPVVGQLLKEGEISEPIPGLYVLENRYLYRDDIGFDEERKGVVDAETLIY